MNPHRAPAVSGTKGASFWLAELNDAHARVLAAIGKLEQLTLGPVPAKDILVNVRWRLSSASLARRLLWGRIHAFLSQQAAQRYEDDLRQLQQADIELLRASSQHVAKWTTEAILADWPGYRVASKRMRRKMIEGIAGEKRLLYPILSSL